MKSYENNSEALAFLSQQKWEDAQRKMFENAKNNPCYQTFNNLGHFLITEGLTCKNGRTRNAFKIGIGYLKKSANIKKTSTNAYALISALNVKKQCQQDCKELEEYIYQYLEQILENEHSLTLKYNYLCLSYRLGKFSTNSIEALRSIVKEQTFSEATSLYLYVLQENGCTEESFELIKQHQAFLDEFDLFVIYLRLKRYEEAYSLCDKIYEFYSLNELLIVAIIECCIKNNDFLKAQKYSKLFFDKTSKDKEYRAFVLSKSKKSEAYRNNIISNYKFEPSLIESCGYFGCTSHRTDWEKEE